METEKQWDGEKIVELKEKDLFLLVWNGEKGYFEKYILNPALKQNVEGEFHFIAGIRMGEL